MSEIHLSKHHGLGNDFLMVVHPDSPADHAELWAPRARAWCHRTRGIGADGLLIAGAADGFDATMTLYNADGSVAEMSGNGIRCFAQAIARARRSLADQHILTGAGPRQVQLLATDDPATVQAAVGMGAITGGTAPHTWAEVGCDPLRPVAHLDVGNPHSVVAVDDVSIVDLAALGAIVPGTNLEIVAPGPEPHAITMRVHERGAGITAACGTGACASAWAARQWGLVGSDVSEITVHMDGGDATVRLDDPTPGYVTLIGPAVHVADVVVTVP